MEKTMWKTQIFVVFVLATQVVASVTLVLNISIVRQVVGFLYLILIPGFIILRILRLDKTDVTELVLFSVGLSIAFLMSIGLLINELGPSISISKPLSTEPLAITISITVILMCILSRLRNREDFGRMILPRELRTSLLIATCLVLPFLSVVGVMFANAFEDNLLLLLIVIAISILFLLVPFSPKFSPYYPLAIVSIASILLLTTSLSSNYVQGYDINKDYFVFGETKDASYWDRYKFPYSSGHRIMWDQIEFNIVNSMLSVTVLPTMFSNILNMEEVLTFKIMYPLIFSLVPLTLYQLYQKQWGKRVAFLSALFFISNEAFFEWRNSAKQMLAELFYLLLFLILLNKDINKLNKWIIIPFFSFALIVSHYTTNYIFLFLIFSTWLCAKIFRMNGKISSAIVLFFLILTLLWYGYVFNGPYDRLLLFIENTFKTFFEEFFLPETRGREVLKAVGIIRSPSFLHEIGRILHNITELFIVIGFITLIAKRKKERLDSEYFLLTSLNMVLLSIGIIIPTFGVGRWYHVTLFFLSPLFILGGTTVLKNMFKVLSLKREEKRESYSLISILTLMVAFFLFQTGFVYEVTGDPVPSSIFLSKYRMDDYTLLISGLTDENDFFGAAWLSHYVDVENRQIYSDQRAKYYVLTTSMIKRSSVVVLSNTTVVTSGSYIYLSRYNTMNEVLIYNVRWPIDIRYSISQLSVFNNTAEFNNKIYSNSASEIYNYDP